MRAYIRDNALRTFAKSHAGVKRISRTPEMMNLMRSILTGHGKSIVSQVLRQRDLGGNVVVNRGNVVSLRHH